MDGEWNSLLDQFFFSFYSIVLMCIRRLIFSLLEGGWPKRNAHVATNLHHSRVKLFYVVLDVQLQEIITIVLMRPTHICFLCLAFLCLSDRFSALDKQKLLLLTQFHPQDSSALDLIGAWDST